MLTLSLRLLLAALSLGLTAEICWAQVTVTRATNFSVDAAPDGRLAIDVLGDIWIVPRTGGTAASLPNTTASARRPRWSPDGKLIVFQAREGDQEKLWLHHIGNGTTNNISAGDFFDQHPAWNPDGERIVYSSIRKNNGFDLWELDLETGLTWRISNLQGDETEPSWSASGDDLIYIHHDKGIWSLMLRRHGQPDRVLESSATRLSSPAWRPDSSLVTILRHDEAGLSIDMVILAEPVLTRHLITGEDFFVAAVTWLDRNQLLYAANGMIRTRLFNAWSSSNVPFRARVNLQPPAPARNFRARKIPSIDAPDRQFVLRTARLFDGLDGGYREGLDIVIDGARIRAIEPAHDRSDITVIDMGDLTALPGIVDARGRLPSDADESLGPLLLSCGITTIVAEHPRGDLLGTLWSGKKMPGPRVLGEEWQVDLDTAAKLAAGFTSSPISPRGHRYEDFRLDTSRESAPVLSGLADARLSSLETLLASRQAKLLARYPGNPRRYSEQPDVRAVASSIVLGSAPNGLPPGIAQHAELRALFAAGLTGKQVLQAAGVNASAALNLGLQLGRIAPGSAADIVLVDGDPLNNIDDVLKVVAVIRNGRFFSSIGLIERAQGARIVE